MSPVPPRSAALVLVTSEGHVLGALPPIPVATPWWQDAGPVVEAAREEFGLDIVLLRRLASELPRPQGGRVTYLAQLRVPLPPLAEAALGPFDGTLDDHPLRLPWARPGGPEADLAWAERVLRERGFVRGGPAEQVRTWNLSSIWRLPLAGVASAWLKVVPPFFAHEGDVLRRLQGGPVPRLIGHDGPRVMLADIPGDDQYDARLPALLEMVSSLVALQVEWAGRTEEMLAIGLPDWRAPALAGAIADVVDRRGEELPPADLEALHAFLAGLPARMDAVAACGIPETLVHGDFHAGNVRGRPGSLTLLDWGDCGVGHPLLDMPAFLAPVPPRAVEPVRDRWLAEWRNAVPASDPARAAALLAPVAAARQSLIYQVFVDGIEPSERPYHLADTPEWLSRTAALFRAEDAAAAGPRAPGSPGAGSPAAGSPASPG